MSVVDRVDAHRDDLVDLGRLLAALVVVEIVASLVYAVSLVGWASWRSGFEATVSEHVSATVWIAGMTLSEVLLSTSRWGWEATLTAVGCYAVAIVLVGAAVRWWSR